MTKKEIRRHPHIPLTKSVLPPINLKFMRVHPIDTSFACISGRERLVRSVVPLNGVVVEVSAGVAAVGDFVADELGERSGADRGV